MGIFLCFQKYFFGIIPPGIFMLWSLETSLIGSYLPSIGVLSVISPMVAGFFNFNLGKWIKDKKWISGGTLPPVS